MAKSNAEAKITEILLMIFFMMYPINPLFNVERKQVDVEELKGYLQENSGFISQVPELLAYFALPYIQNPVEHPNFCHLFTSKWLIALKERVLESTSEGPSSLLENIFTSNFPIRKSLTVSQSSSLSKLFAFEPDMTFAPKTAEPQNFLLNFTSISYDLNNIRSEPQLCALLQALRWRITQCESSLSLQNLESLIKNNILSTIPPHNGLLDNLLSLSKRIKEYTLRLMNVMAFRKIGRDYLLNKETLVNLVLKTLFIEKNKSSLCQICLSLLQKLSLRKSAQVSMIKHDMIKWIVKVFKREIGGVDEEMIEFCTGIMMNLSVRSAAKEKFEEIEGEILNAVVKCLNLKNGNITKYAHCLLYTLLSYGSFRVSAKKMGLDRLLKNLRSKCEENLIKQIDLILEQMEVTEDSNVSLLSEIDTDETYIIIDEDNDDIINDPSILKGNELLKSKYESKSLEEIQNSNGFQSRDKIPRTPYI